MRYNLKFCKLTLYGLTRPQSIRKSKQMSGQTVLSSQQDLEFNRDFATFLWLKKGSLSNNDGDGYKNVT